MPTRRTAILTAFVLLISLFAGVQTSAADDSDGLENLYSSSQHGYEPYEIRGGLSLDHDNVSDGSVSEIDSYEKYGYATDLAYDKPPTKYQDWNRWEIANFSTGDQDSSRYPASATLRSGRWIQDAHATKFHQTGTIRARINDSTTIHYSSPEGTVYGAVDYRLRDPVSDTNGSDGRKTLRSVEESGIESVCLIHELDESDIRGRENPCDDPATGWAVMGEETNRPSKPAISFSNTPNLGDNDRYTLVGVITTEVNVVKKVRRSNEVCSDNSNGTENCETYYYFVTTSDKTVTDRVIVTDSWQTSVYDTEAVAVSETDRAGNQYDKNTSEIYFQTRGHPWAGATINNSHLTSQWRYYTRRDPGWDTIEASSKTGEKEVAEFSTVPIRTYAVPVTVGNAMRTNISDGGTVIEKVDRGSIRSSPASQLHPNVDIPVAGTEGGNYTVTTGVSVSSNSADIDDVTVHGAVADKDVSATDMRLNYHTERRESNLTVKVISANASHVYLDITLRDNETGKPIDLTDPKRDGIIIFPNGREVVTNSSGEASIFYNGSRSGQAVFQPSPWYGKSVAYKSDWDSYRGPFRIQSVYDIVQWTFGILIGLAPILIALYYLNSISYIETWPPWKVF